jgi:cell division protein FtsZ
VSVVATGIDIAKGKADHPAVRRSMAEPLKAAHAAAPMAAMTAEPARREAPMALQPRQTPAPAAEPAPMMAEVQEQGLFDASAYARPEASEAVDDVPAPAYRPQAQPDVQRPAAAASHDVDPASYIAPRPRMAGQPSPEALKRLQAAVSRAPSSAPQRQAAPVARAPEAAPKPAERRFGIGNLINRMAGGPAVAESAQAKRAQPPVTSYDEDVDQSADQDKIEIPAFLRRQAN